jgi:multiple sugar transport system permease protein
MGVGQQAQGQSQAGAAPDDRRTIDAAGLRARLRSDRLAQSSFIWPAILVVLFLSIFPLLVSLYLSLSRFGFARGGIDIRFIGLENYKTLLVGSQQTHFLGLIRPPTPVGWLALAVGVAVLGWLTLRTWRSRRISLTGRVFRTIGAIFAAALLWLLVETLLSEGGRPGTVVVTLVYVFFGVSVQYLLGLGLASLATQRLPGRRFFRVVFLLPMMITPVGVAYMFRMLTDTSKGPFEPLWAAVGMGTFSWVNDPWGARIAVMIGDIWQWTPFMFIVLVAALEAVDTEQYEAALVDGASRWQGFRYITLPAILPVSTTLILIRIIEAFKIVDLPNIMTGGGPGTATESLTLHAYIDWRSLNLGQSAGIAYSLLFLVTVVGIAYVNLIRRRVVEA